MVVADENLNKSGIRKVLESVRLVPFAFLYSFFCWFFELSFATVVGFTVLCVLILLFCENINNLFALVFFIAFFIRDISGINWTGYMVCIVVACASMIFYTVKTAVKRGGLRKGKMFYALLVADVAFLLGGAIGRFSLLQFGIVLGFEAAIMLLYILAINCTENLTEYLASLFIVGALFISAEIICVKIMDGDLFNGSPMGLVFFFSAHTMNTAAIFILLGMTGCYAMGVKKKYDLFFLLLALFFFFAIFLSCCRTVLAISGIVLAIIYVVMFVKTPDKIAYLCMSLVILGAAIIFAIIFKDYILEFIQMIIVKLNRGLNGRESLWPWCWQKFTEYPVLGYGFISSEAVPTVRVNLVLAHNTLLQWLTSLGVLGASMMSLFYICKYKTLFKGHYAQKLFAVLSVLGIELSGMLDQAAAMDVFVFLLPLVILSGVERETAAEVPLEEFISIGTERNFAELC